MNKVWGRFGSPAAPVWPPRPVDRGSLFARSGPLRGPARRGAPGARVDARHAAQAIHALPALTHAQNIHVLLAAIPGRQGTAHCDGCCGFDGSLFRNHVSDWAMVVPGRGLLRPRVSHGWLTEPGSNPRAGTTPAEGYPIGCASENRCLPAVDMTARRSWCGPPGRRTARAAYT